MKKNEKRKVYGRAARLAAILAYLAHPEELSDIIIDMIYSILFHS